MAGLMKTYRVERRVTKVVVTSHEVRAHDEEEAVLEAQHCIANGDQGTTREEEDPHSTEHVRAVDALAETLRLEEAKREQEARARRASAARLRQGLDP